MAQQQSSIQIHAPGFMGLNTEDSPINQDPSFASVADHCVIDKFGRISSRRGLHQRTSNPEILNDRPVEQTYEHVTEAGVSFILACTDSAIFTEEGTTGELTKLTLPTTVTDANWQIASLNDKAYFVQEGHEPLVFDPTAPTEMLTWLELPTIIPTLGAIGYPNCVHAAFGRLWTGNFDNDTSIVAYSGLLDGQDYTTDAGFFDTTKYWPSGFDQITSLYAHNNFMMFFGNNNILVYQVGDAGPTTAASLVDTIEGIGCIARDSVQPTGNDLFFLDATGVRGLARTIQEKSIPLGDLSINVRTDIRGVSSKGDLNMVRASYSPDENMYIVMFPYVHECYVFDTRITLDNGALRATKWPAIEIHCAAVAEDRRMWFGGMGGLYDYISAEDFAEGGVVPIKFKYHTHPQTWGSPEKLKFPKQAHITMIGNDDQVTCLHWAFDYSDDFNIVCQARGNTRAHEPDTDGTSRTISSEIFNLWDSGTNVRFGIEADVAYARLSIQEMSIQTTIGRTL